MDTAAPRHATTAATFQTSRRLALWLRPSPSAFAAATPSVCAVSIASSRSVSSLTRVPSQLQCPHGQLPARLVALFEVSLGFHEVLRNTVVLSLAGLQPLAQLVHFRAGTLRLDRFGGEEIQGFGQHERGVPVRRWQPGTLHVG